MSDDVRPGEVFEIEPENSGGLLTHLPWWLVAAYAVARLVERKAEPAVPSDRTLQHRFHLRDVLHKDGVGNGARHRNAQLGRHMRRNRQVCRRREMTDHHRVGNAADSGHVGLKNIQRAPPDRLVKRGRAVEALAARARDRRVLAQAHEPVQVGRLQRFFDPIQIVGFEPAQARHGRVDRP